MVHGGLEGKDVRKRNNHKSNICDNPANSDADVELGKVDAVLLCAVPKCMNWPACTNRRNILMPILAFTVTHDMRRRTVEIAQATIKNTNP